MKKTIALALMLLTSATYAQDVITLTDGRTVQTKILELSPDAVKYKKFDNQEGPTYTVPLNTISKIKYANGSEESFNTAPAATEQGQANSSGNNGGDLPPIFKGTFDVNDKATEAYIEAVAQNAGAKILERCTGRSDNSTTDIFYGEVFRDDIAVELHIPILVKWDKGLANKVRSIRGEIIVDRNGKRSWKYQSDSGITFSGCAKGIIEL